MDKNCVVSEDFDCPSLMCEEQDLDSRNNQTVEKKNVEDERFNQIKSTEIADYNEQKSESEYEAVSESVATPDEDPQEGHSPDKDKNNESINDKVVDEENESLENKDEQKRGRKRRCKKLCERTRSKRRCKSNEDNVDTEKTALTQEAAASSPTDASSVLEPTVGLMDSCDFSDPGCGTSGLCCPPIPVPLMYSSQPPVPIQPAPSQPQGTKRLHSPYLPHSVPQTNSQPLEMEITQVYSTRRSIRYSTRGRGRSLGFPVLPALENMGNCLLPPAPKKKARTLYTTDQLEHLESLFQEDHYPDAEKRKAIAASVGVTPQRIMVWFQNRRAKWRKVERLVTAKIEQRSNKAGPHCSPPNSLVNSVLPNLAPNKPPAFSGHFTTKMSQIAPAAPIFPTCLYSNLSTSPGQSRVRDGDQHQLSSQGGLAEYHPRPMHSPPPIRRASLPLFTAAYNPATPNPPLLNTLVHTSPLFLDALEAGSSLAHHDALPLQTDTSSLFEFGEKLDYSASTQQNFLYQLQTSYPSNQPQHQPQASLPRMSYLTPSPYLTPNPPDSNPTSYLTFGPGGGSTGVVTYSGGHTFFQSQSTGQVLLQSTGHHGGITAYQPYSWGNMYSQPTMHQRPQCAPTYSSSLGAPRDHQLAPSATLPSSFFFSRGDHGPSNPQRSSHTQTRTTSCSTTVLPPVSTLRPSRLRAETTPTKAAPLLPSQVSPTSPESPPVPPCVKIEYDSPREIHSHFHCDFSPIHF